MESYGFQLKTKLLQLGLSEEFQRKNGGAKTVLNGLLELHGIVIKATSMQMEMCPTQLQQRRLNRMLTRGAL